MENPDVEMEIKTDESGASNKVTVNYKVNSRGKDDGRSASEFVEMMTALFGGLQNED